MDSLAGDFIKSRSVVDDWGEREVSSRSPRRSTACTGVRPEVDLRFRCRLADAGDAHSVAFGADLGVVPVLLLRRKRTRGMERQNQGNDGTAKMVGAPAIARIACIGALPNLYREYAPVPKGRGPRPPAT